MARTVARRAQVLSLLLIAACGPRSPAVQPAPQRPPSLRLVAITPDVGSRVDSSTTIEATLVYEIPGFDRTRAYFVMPTFVSTTGGAFNRPPDARVRLESAAGAVRIRYPLRMLLRDGRLASPLTGQFFLLEGSPTPPDTVFRDSLVGGQTRQLRIRSAGAVRARSRAFFYNGGGPADERRGVGSLAAALEEFFTYTTHRAIAIARDSAGAWVSGYAFAHASRDSAMARALTECRERLDRRALAAECAIAAVDDVALLPGEAAPPDAPSAAADAPVRARFIRARTAEVPAGMVPIDSTSYDVDGDGSVERIILHAQVERDAAGRPLWEDAHRWLLLVHDGPARYPLVDALVPFGTVGFSIVAGEDAAPPRIVAERHDRDGVQVESFSWDGPRGGFVARALTVRGTTVFRSRDVR